MTDKRNKFEIGASISGTVTKIGIRL